MMLAYDHRTTLLRLGAQPQAVEAPKVAIIPWTLKDGTDTAQKTARDTIQTLFEKSKHEIIPAAKVTATWEQGMGKPAIPMTLGGSEQLTPLPTPKDLLELGKRLQADFVCAGRLSWHTKSVWVSLGPKTKAEATVDVLIVDVKKAEVALNAEKVKSDSTKKESGLETAGALLVTMGVTALSGGPKTPHQQRAAQNAIALSMEPWLRTRVGATKKIDGR